MSIVVYLHFYLSKKLKKNEESSLLRTVKLVHVPCNNPPIEADLFACIPIIWHPYHQIRMACNTIRFVCQLNTRQLQQRTIISCRFTLK